MRYLKLYLKSSVLELKGSLLVLESNLNSGILHGAFLQEKLQRE
jgi:hypothetical protein